MNFTRRNRERNSIIRHHRWIALGDVSKLEAGRGGQDSVAMGEKPRILAAGWVESAGCVDGLLRQLSMVIASESTMSHAVHRLHTVSAAQIAQLAEVLIDCVDGGASVGFMAPLSMEKASAFWRDVAAGAERGERVLLVIEDAQGIVGAVQVVLAQPENQPHRADVSKMLVHRRGRRTGLGAALMQAAEAVARECGKTLLVLDTASAEAERVYERSGWQRVGTIPGFALWPQGGACDTTFFYRQLAPLGAH